MFLNSRRGVPSYREISGVRLGRGAAAAGQAARRHPARRRLLHAEGERATRPRPGRFIEFANSAEGQTIVAKSGRTVPSLKAVAESPAFLDPTAKPASNKVFLDVIPLHPRRAGDGELGRHRVDGRRGAGARVSTVRSTSTSSSRSRPSGRESTSATDAVLTAGILAGASLRSWPPCQRPGREALVLWADHAEALPRRCFHHPPRPDLGHPLRPQRLEPGDLGVDVVGLDVEVDPTLVIHLLDEALAAARPRRSGRARGRFAPRQADRDRRWR